MQRRASEYDEVPYESHVVPTLDPRHLSIASGLHGGPAVPTRGYRVIELGCGDGTNLLPLAFYQADATFLGVDQSVRAIETARRAATSLGIENVGFEEADLLDPGAILDETFDTILIHGVFSWVEEAVRSRILDLCERCLAPEGLVTLSYNVRAGWMVRGAVRDLLCDAVDRRDPPAHRIDGARRFAAHLAALIADSDHPYHALLVYELERAARASDSYLFHEYLCPQNVALDHRDVVAMMQERGLVYVCDASFHTDEGRIPEPLREALEALGLRGAALEQPADVLGYRRFRSSVFARREAMSGDTGARVRSAEDAWRERLAGEGSLASSEPLDLAASRPHRLACVEARRGNELTTPHHTVVVLDEEERAIVQLFGEEPDADAVAGALAHRRTPRPADSDSQPSLRNSVLRCLDRLARHGLLEAT